MNKEETEKRIKEIEEAMNQLNFGLIKIRLK
jgi:hypothetical protein